MQRRLALLLVAALAGCGEAPAPRPQVEAKPATPVKPAQPAPSPKKPVAPDAFASVQAALDAMVKANEVNDQDQLRLADEWIKLQGAAAGPVLFATIQNEEAPLAARIAACRGAGKLGAAGQASLLAALSSPKEQLRLKACETLATMKPPAPEVVAKMLELIDGNDERMRFQAIKGVRLIGPPAKDAAPKLLAILNSQKENDGLRAEAKAALQSCAPRKTFNDR